MAFGLEEAIKAADKAVTSVAGRPLSDVEIIILKGAWERLEYDQIAAQNQYATSYVSNDIAPKLWKLLTDALGEKVKKSNFKAALRRYWEEQGSADTVPLAAHTSAAATASPARERASDSRMQPRQVSPRANPLSSQPVSSIALPEDSIEESVFQENYIERPPIEDLCVKTITTPGSLLRIKVPKYMGKTSLVNRLMAQVETQNFQTASLSFELADRRKHFVSLDNFLRWFCLNISRELGIPGELEEFWDEEGIGAKVSCTTYFEQYLLPQCTNSLILCLDDIDLLFPHPEVYEDFFGLLRSWYEKARSRRIWQRLRLILVHATDVYIRLNIHQSPFNVGVPISLTDFTVEQATNFANTFGVIERIDDIFPLLQWVGGHPYLLKLAFTKLMDFPEFSLEDLLSDIAAESGLYSSHLREYLLLISQEPDLASALKQVVEAKEPIKLESVLAYKLQSMGLITLSGNEAMPRCKLYRNYFREQLKN
jgi:hypothetical protein